MARQRRPLVAQHLERISRATVERYQRVIRDYVRGRQGVYALYRRDRLYYVGLASNLGTRLKQHLKDRHGESWDRFSVYLTTTDHHLRELESLVLRIVRPKGNKQQGKLRGSENLKGALTKELRAYYRAELNELLGRARRPARTRQPRATATVNGRSPVLAKFFERRVELRARFKGKVIRALVLADGTVRFNGRIYNSPSLAAAAACRRRACNGWTFWEYKRAAWDWASLDEIRKKRRSRKSS